MLCIPKYSLNPIQWPVFFFQWSWVSGGYKVNMHERNMEVFLLFFFSFVGYFLYLHFKRYPLSSLPSGNPLFHSPPPASMRVLPYTCTHSCLPAQAFPSTGALKPHKTKSLFSHWFPTRPFSATYAARAMGPSICILLLVAQLAWWNQILVRVPVEPVLS